MTVNNITNDINCSKQPNTQVIATLEQQLEQQLEQRQQKGDIIKPIDKEEEHIFFDCYDDGEYEAEPFEDESLIYLNNFNTAIKINNEDKFIMAYDLSLYNFLAQEHTGGKLTEVCQELANEIYEHLVNIKTTNISNTFSHSCGNNCHSKSLTKQNQDDMSAILGIYGISIIEERYDISLMDAAFDKNIYRPEY